MFENKKLTVTVDKKDKTAPDVVKSPEEFEEKFDIALEKLEKFGTKIFLGIAAFVVMDTWRKVTVERAKNEHTIR